MVQAIKRDEVFIEPEGIHVETHQPERRSRKPPLLLIHGALTGSWLWTEFAAYLAERGWEAHAMNLRGHFTSASAELDEVSMRDYANDVGVAMRHLGRPAVLIGWGIGALAALMHAERPTGARPRAAGAVTAGRRTAASAGRARAARRAGHLRRRVVGLDRHAEELRERMPDMDEHDLEKMTELLDGARESGRARRERMQGVAIDPSGMVEIPSLVIGAGLDDVIHPPRRAGPPTCWAPATSTSRPPRISGWSWASTPGPRSRPASSAGSRSGARRWHRLRGRRSVRGGDTDAYMRLYARRCGQKVCIGSRLLLSSIQPTTRAAFV